MGKTMEHIATHVTTSSTELVVTFTDIPQTYGALQLISSFRTSAAVNSAYLLITFNNDSTTANYRRFYQETYYSANVIGQYIYRGSGSATTAFGMLGDNRGGQLNVNAFGTMLIPQYAKTELNKVYKITSGYNVNQTSIANSRTRNMFGVMGWDNTSAITRIDITQPTAANWIQKDTSSFTLYGWQES